MGLNFICCWKDLGGDTVKVPGTQHYLRVDYCDISSHLWSRLAKPVAASASLGCNGKSCRPPASVLPWYASGWFCASFFLFAFSASWSLSLLSMLISSVSSIFLETQVRINNELDIYLFSFMGSMMDICAYLFICFCISRDLKSTRDHMFHLL